MNTLELKGGLHDLIAGIDDKTLLLKLEQVITETIDQNNSIDFWDDLTIDQQQELQNALQESEQPENLVDHQVVLDKYKRWPSK